VLFRTAEGTKLVSAAINNQVLLEADEHNVAEGWSVIVQGGPQACSVLTTRSTTRSEHSYFRGRQR